MGSVLSCIRQLNVWTMLLRLCLAFLFGGCVGLERERRGRTAGLRTHILVSLGACLTVLSGVFMTEALGLDSDPLRIGAQVISGIGFLGAGTIMVTRQNHIKGLTTAAGLWTTAAIGLALGCGFYEGALIALVLSMIAIVPLDNLEKYIKGRKHLATAQVYLEIGGLDHVNSVISELNRSHFEVMLCEVEEAKSRNPVNVGMRIEMRYPDNICRQDMIHDLSAIDHVLYVVEIHE